MDSHNNGFAESVNRIEERFQADREYKRGYMQETNALRLAGKEEISRMKRERLDLQKRASEHAGNIGLIYRAEDNSFTRVVIVDSEPVLPERPVLAMPPSPAPELAMEKPARPAAPERPTPPALEQVPRPAEIDQKWQQAVLWKSIVSWTGAVIVGLFVGFGLLTIAGLPYSRPEDRGFLIGGFLVGVAAIVGIKLLMDVMWSEAGRRYALHRLSPPPTPELRREVRNSNLAYLALAGLVSIGLVLVEGWLGGQAMVAYSAKASYDGNPTINPTTAILIAMAVSSATMLFSGFLGHQKGQRTLTHEDVRNRHYELAVKEHETRVGRVEQEYQAHLADWQGHQDRVTQLHQKWHDLEVQAVEDYQKAHEASLEQWRERLNGTKQRHEEGMTDQAPRTEDLESFQKESDYRALCAYIGQIDALNHHIADAERRLTNDMISRGYAKGYLS